MTKYAISGNINQKHTGGNMKPITKLTLKAWRVLREMEQKDVAKKLHITPGALSLYESGKRPMRQNTLDKIMKLYDCTYEQIAFK